VHILFEAGMILYRGLASMSSSAEEAWRSSLHEEVKIAKESAVRVLLLLGLLLGA